MRCMTAPPSMNPIGFASFGSTTCTISVADADGGFGASGIGQRYSARAAVVEECLQPQPQLFRQVVFAQRLQQSDRRSERADEGGALGAAAEVLFEIVPDVGRQPAVEVVGQQSDEAGAVGGITVSRKLKSRESGSSQEFTSSHPRSSFQLHMRVLKVVPDPQAELAACAHSSLLPKR